MPASSSNDLANAPLPAAPQISKYKSKKKKSTAASEATAVKSSKANQALDNCQAAPLLSVMSPSPNKSKVRPHHNFTAVENHEPDVTHDLETLDLSTPRQTSKSTKKKPIAMAASIASKMGVSSIKRN
ncbi:hypothetical protein JB92DRAFT_3135702 [Gautieria morchelliformis]|nr:hypothetical protein JB92DRAFT_3135702 [Gautieria morchelliformis]